MSISINTYKNKVRRMFAVGSIGVLSLAGATFTLGNILRAPVYADVSGAFTYTSADGEATITDYDPEVGGADVVIPTTLGTDTVVAVDGHAFQSNDITSVSIPSTVTSIGDYAFDNNDITTLTIPSSVETVGNGAFSGNPIASLTLNEGLTTIRGYAFSDNELSSVAIPNSVETLESGAFTGAGTLSTITIGTTDYTGPANLTIGSSIFDNGEITTLTLGNSIISISPGAFYGATQISSVTIPDSVETIGGGAFNNMPNLTSLTLGSSVKTIAGGAFFGNAITSLVIPNSVETIGNGAFGDNAIASLTIGTGLTEITGGAFTGNKLTSVVIPANITAIGIQAFYNNDLTSVVIEGTPTIDKEAFAANGFKNADLPVGVAPGDAAWYDYIEEHASLVAVYATSPSQTYTDAIYVDEEDNRVIGGLIINPSALTVTYEDEDGNELHTPTYHTSPLFSDYLIANTLDTTDPVAPTVDTSDYYHLGEVANPVPFTIAGFTTPATAAVTLTTPNSANGGEGTAYTYVYAEASDDTSNPDDTDTDTDNTPTGNTGGTGNETQTPGAPNTGLQRMNTPQFAVSTLGGALLALLGGAVIAARRKRL